MSFQPALPIGGYAGWRFLNRTMETQQAVFQRSPMVQRDAEYFREQIGKVETPEDLVSDRRLLRVALGAFGLQDDIENRFFIRKVLEDGSIDPRGLANRLADRRYLEFTRAFGFDLGTPNTRLSDFADRTLAAYNTRQFELAVGNTDENMRLALNLRRELGQLAERDSSERTKWLTVLGTPPLRKAFETAFGLPTAFGALDLDRQVEVMQTRTRAAFRDSTVEQFTDPDKVEDLVRRFLLRADIQTGGAFGGGPASGSAALQLLQSATLLAPLGPTPMGAGPFRR